MNAYPIILERAEDGGWSAIAPDLPGLLLAADTREELLAEAPSAIADYLVRLCHKSLKIRRFWSEVTSNCWPIDLRWGNSLS